MIKYDVQLKCNLKSSFSCVEPSSFCGEQGSRVSGEGTGAGPALAEFGRSQGIQEWLPSGAPLALRTLVPGFWVCSEWHGGPAGPTHLGNERQRPLELLGHDDALNGEHELGFVGDAWRGRDSKQGLRSGVGQAWEGPGQPLAE